MLTFLVPTFLNHTNNRVAGVGTTQYRHVPTVNTRLITLCGSDTIHKHSSLRRPKLCCFSITHHLMSRYIWIENT